MYAENTCSVLANPGNSHLLLPHDLLAGNDASHTISIRYAPRCVNRVLDNFDPARVAAAYDEAKIEELLENTGIVRNRQKVRSAAQNARAFLKVQEDFGSFAAYIWGFVDGKPIQNRWQTMSQLPAKTELSEAISKDLKKRGFNFVGPTIVYAFMQTVGMVNDHTVDCFRYHEVAAAI